MSTPGNRNPEQADVSAVKRQLEREIRGDLLAGRSSLAGLRQDQRQSLQAAVSRPIAPAAGSQGSPAALEPRDPRPRWIAELVGPLVPQLTMERRPQLSNVATWAERLDRLEELEADLYRLLATSAPQSWNEMRRPLVNLMRRARRALRAAERAEVKQ